MSTVSDLLRRKGTQVWSVAPDTNVLEALNLLAEKEIGALMVLENNAIVGIISERDVVRFISKTGKCLVDTPVRDHMTKDVFTVSPEMTIEECMSLMTDKRIRHLPVVKDGSLIGLVSIGDVVKEVISTHQATIHHLENYIEGADYGR
jgi:CBS domain-containing protein